MKSWLPALALLSVGACSEAPSGTVVDAGLVSDVAAVDGGAADAPVAADVPVGPVDAGSGADVSPTVARLIAERPYRLAVPDGNVPTRAAPLLILLHGYGASGSVQELYFRMTRETNARGILYAIPDGTLDVAMRRFWNATDACCNFGSSAVDDVAYLDAIIDDVSARYAVDPRRIFLIGHSNGGFMAHRMACARSARIAGVVSLAGATYADAARCTPSEPVAVLQVHGTNDVTIQYTGGTNVVAAYPGAATSVSRWATNNRCATMPTAGAMLDLESALPGAETRVERYEGCAGGAAELWTIQNGGHLPALAAQWSTLTLDWLMAHPKPAR
jgi:polyhydroxybutyrate depolymerase